MFINRQHIRKSIFYHNGIGLLHIFPIIKFEKYSLVFTQQKIKLLHIIFRISFKFFQIQRCQTSNPVLCAF